MKNALKAGFWSAQNGATAVEYAFIAAMIVVAIIGAVAAIGGNLQGAYQSVLDMF